jgi:hypothetical protein
MQQPGDLLDRVHDPWTRLLDRVADDVNPVVLHGRYRRPLGAAGQRLGERPVVRGGQDDLGAGGDDRLEVQLGPSGLGAC